MNETPVQSAATASQVSASIPANPGFETTYESRTERRYRTNSPETESLTAGSGVSLILPAYNEQARIGSTLDKYLPALEFCTRQFEIIVVVDGSDKTAEVARHYRNQGVRVVQEDHKLGKGGAILNGFRQAQFDAVGYVDADGSLMPSDLTCIVRSILDPGTDCVVASRWIPGSRWLHREPLTKMLAGRVFNLLVRSLLQVPVRDTQCGAKFYRRNVIDRLLSQVSVTNLTTDVGFLFHAHKNGARIYEVPVTWDDDPRSRFHLTTMIPIMFLTVIGIRLMNLPLGRYVPKSLVHKFQQFLGSI